ncbi:putative peptidoglycan biosynthesis protein MviN [Amycolatopsis sp. M39]|nr:putative peptidoglycan biosynthesis protein MviN [Amycolatopsis sp. M39]
MASGPVVASGARAEQHAVRCAAAGAGRSRRDGVHPADRRSAGECEVAGRRPGCVAPLRFARHPDAAAAAVRPGRAAADCPPRVEPRAAAPSIASLVSRVTGFLGKIMLVWAVGTGVENDSFTIANTLPNSVFELLLGGVLTSVVMPLIVRSQDDPDGGAANAHDGPDGSGRGHRTRRGSGARADLAVSGAGRKRRLRTDQRVRPAAAARDLLLRRVRAAVGDPCASIEKCASQPDTLACQISSTSFSEPWWNSCMQQIFLSSVFASNPACVSVARNAADLVQPAAGGMQPVSLKKPESALDTYLDDGLACRFRDESGNPAARR